MKEDGGQSRQKRRARPAQPVDPETLRRLSQELASRSGHGERMLLRIRLWRLTIGFSYVVKRLLDICASLLGIVLLSPLLLAIALGIKLSSRGPIIFSQIRVGRFGRHFRFYKFRSMYVDAEKRKAELLSRNLSKDDIKFKDVNDPRITPLGRKLRQTSLDELPQLFNVLLGDMSLVGPRPPLPEEVQKYSLEDRKRLNVLPGITCIWQVSGRSNIPFKKQVQLDKQYILSQSIWQDMMILLRTIPAVITGRGAY